MEDSTNFIERLEIAISQKKEYFDGEKLPELLDVYRLHYTCVKNINEMLIKKSLVEADPYKLDKRISEIIVTETTSFPETEIPKILGSRLSDYEMMLDFICTYVRFSVDNIDITKIKKLLELNKVFDWSSVSQNSASANTRALSIAINNARKNASAVLVSTINDSLEKCAQSMNDISRTLAELADFQRELYKSRIRKEVIESPDFNKDNAYKSCENELSEIKKVYLKIYGKKNFYIDLVNEIIQEDQGEMYAALREKLLGKLQIQKKENKVEKKGPDLREMLIQIVANLGGIAPIMTQLISKLEEDFDLLFFEKKTFFSMLKSALRKAFGLKEKPRMCNLTIEDAKTGNKNTTKIDVNAFLEDLKKKQRLYSSFAARGSEFGRVMQAGEEQILNFVDQQIKDNKQYYVTINSFDDYFKASVDIFLKPKLKGLKIDLSGYRNVIIEVNKKRGEYASYKEEQEQLKSLGMSINGK